MSLLHMYHKRQSTETSDVYNVGRTHYFSVDAPSGTSYPMLCLPFKVMECTPGVNTTYARWVIKGEYAGVGKFYVVLDFATGQIRTRVYDPDATAYTDGSYSTINEEQWYYLFVFNNTTTNGSSVRVYVYDHYDKSTLIDSAIDLNVAHVGQPPTAWSCNFDQFWSRGSDGDSVRIIFSDPLFLDTSYLTAASGTIALEEVGEWVRITHDTANSCMEPIMIIDDSLAFFRDAEITENHVAGTQTTQTAETTTGIFQTNLSSIFSTLKANLDDTLDLPVSNFSLPDPFGPIADAFNSFWNDIIAEGFELVTDSILNVIFALLDSGVWTIEELFYGLRGIIEDGSPDVLDWLRDNLISISANSPDTYNYNIQEKIEDIMTIVDDWDNSILSTLKLPFTKVYPLGFLDDTHANLKIPTRYDITLLGNNLGTYTMLELIMTVCTLGILNPATLDSKVPLSEYAGYHDDDSARRTTGFTYEEGVSDMILVTAVISILYILAKFLPSDLVVKIAWKLVDIIKTSYSIEDVLATLNYDYESGIPAKTIIEYEEDIEIDVATVDSKIVTMAATKTLADVIVEVDANETKIDGMRGSSSLDDIISDTENIQSKLDAISSQFGLKVELGT